MSKYSDKYNKKFHFLRVRVNDDLKQEIEAAAELVDMSVSSFLLECYFQSVFNITKDYSENVLGIDNSFDIDF